MENQVFSFDIEVGGVGESVGISDDAIEIEHTVDDDEITDTPGASTASVAATAASFYASGMADYIPKGELDLEPYEGMEFESEEAAKAFYNSYARRVGFSTQVTSSRRSRRDGAIIHRSLVCAKEGFRNLNEKRTKDREIKRPRIITRVGKSGVVCC